MDKQRRDPVIETLARYLGIGLALVLLAAVVVGLVYALYAQFSDNGRHWIAVAATFGLLVTAALGYVAGRAAGYRQGLSESRQSPVMPQAAQPAYPPVVYDASPRLPDLPRVFSAEESTRLMQLLGDLDAQ